MVGSFDDVLSDLAAEYDRLDEILTGLTPSQWTTASGVPDWTVRDVVVHLAQTEEAVSSALAAPAGEWTTRDQALDLAIDASVRADDMAAAEVLERWRTARHASVAALGCADPRVAVPWAAAPLKPRTLATTRLAEHWAHALDICGPLGVALPDTDRLRHIAWLGHATLPYAMGLAGLAPVEIRCMLDAPNGGVWTFGPTSASEWITGSAGTFCRVGARRLAADKSGLAVSGPIAAAALQVLRNYAV